jgi:uncharacterized Zn finger protein
MCKHVAAVLYGVGARLDAQPELLFRLRAVDEKDLVTGIDKAITTAKPGAAAGKVLETDDLSAMFGLDMAANEPPATKRATAKRASARKTSARKKGKAKAAKPATRRVLAGVAD